MNRRLLERISLGYPVAIRRRLQVVLACDETKAADVIDSIENTQLVGIR